MLLLRTVSIYVIMSISLILHYTQPAISAEPVSYGGSSNSNEIINPSSAIFKLMKEDVANAIANALVEDGVAEKVRVKITNNHNRVLYQHSLPLDVEIRGLQYDVDRMKWSANIFIVQDSGSNVVSAMPISGRYEPLVEVPVLKSRLYSDDKIKETDITMKLYPESKIRKDVITDPQKIVGMSPRRAISAYRPIRSGEIKVADIVHKGDIVHLRYRTNNMEISTIAEALESGAEGDNIRVKNKDSGIAVYAEIISPKEVEVRSILSAKERNLASR